MSDDFDFEPVRGLPERLPAGERMLWQGNPHWRALLKHMFHARVVAAYFGLLAVWRLVSDLNDGRGVGEALVSALWIVPVAAAGLGLLALLAWLIARTTVYTITERRLVMRFGVALSMTVNVPFKVVEAADLRTHAGGVGDIPLTLARGQRLSYLVLWPHVRPWRFAKPQPMLRGVRDAARVAEILGTAYAAATTDAVETKSKTPRTPGLTVDAGPPVAAAS